MNKLDQLPTGFTRRESLLAMLGAAAALAGCGGGGDDTAGVGLGGTGAFSVGPITGIGSIIVNGIRYDDSSASIDNDDSPFRREDFRLGMVVAVQGSPVVNGRSTASRIVLTSELVGPMGRHERIVPGVAQKKLQRSDGRGACMHPRGCFDRFPDVSDTTLRPPCGGGQGTVTCFSGAPQRLR